MEITGVNKKRNEISWGDQKKTTWNFYGVLVFGLGNSNGCDTITASKVEDHFVWTFQGLSDKSKNSRGFSGNTIFNLIFSGITQCTNIYLMYLAS